MNLNLFSIGEVDHSQAYCQGCRISTKRLYRLTGGGERFCAPCAEKAAQPAADCLAETILFAIGSEELMAGELIRFAAAGLQLPAWIPAATTVAGVMQGVVVEAARRVLSASHKSPDDVRITLGRLEKWAGQ